MEIGFVGLGKLGLPCAEAMACYHSVKGYDTVTRKSNNLTLVHEMEDLKDQDIIFVAVPTPHSKEYDGSRLLPEERRDFDYSTVKEVLSQLNKFYTKTVVLISTVLPGTIARELLPLCKNFHLVYNPYLIAMGTVTEDFFDPEMIILGNDDGLLEEFYLNMIPDARIVKGTYEEAESIKIFYNTFITMKISFANMVMDFSEKLGADCDRIMNAIQNSSKRITSQKYLTSGMGDGGPCHPRDNIALSFLSESLNIGYDLFGNLIRIREKQAENLVDFLIKTSKENDNLPIFIHGLTYKPGVESVEGSYSCLIKDICHKKYGINILGIDPYFNQYDCVTGVILLAHNANITFGKKQGLYCDFGVRSIVVDPWGDYENPNLTVIRYGRGVN